MLEKIEKAVACICVTAMAILVFANVIARYVFNHSLAFSDEMSTYLFVLMSFMGTAIAARRKAHLGLSIVTDRVSPKAQKAILSVMYFIAAFFCLLVVVFGVQMVISQYQLGQETASMQWPEWIYGSFVPIGAAFAMVAFAEVAVKTAKGQPAEKEELGVSNKYMNLDPQNPRWADRDRMVLSKGHVCPIQYACLASVGFFPESELDTLRKEGSKLQGHPSMTKCPGIDISTGSLGQGLACAAGMAMAGKLDRKAFKVFCVVGDGEAQEGEIWEAANTAHKYGLDNLITFVDYNNLQLDGTCDEIMPNGDLGEKFKAFGWETIEIDGHSMEEIVAALDKCYASHNGKPKCIYAHTVKGKGVSFMENQCGWHGVAPNQEQYEQAMSELKAQLAD